MDTPHRPYLRRESVVRHLDSLLYDSQSASQLTREWAGLLIVEQIANQLPHADPDLRHEYAVRDLLTGMIATAYADVRRALSLAPPDVKLTVKAVERWLQADAAPRNPALLGWSLLYHRYIRADLDLNVNQLAGWISVGERTFRRYQAYAVRLLTYRLIQAEYDARHERKQRHLLTALPPVPARRLIGREWESALHLLDQHAHLLITGVSGVGKTAFAHVLVRRLIESNRVDAVLWLDQPRSLWEVVDEIAHLFQIDPPALAERLLATRLALVLDGVRVDGFELAPLLRALSAACVIVVADQTIPFDGAALMLRELTADQTTALVRDLFQQYGVDDDVRAVSDYLYSRLGGNPGALKTMIAGWALDDWMRVEQQVTHHLFGRLYQSFTPTAQLVWTAFAVTPRLSADEIIALADEDALSHLLRAHLLERQGDAYAISLGGASDYVRHVVSFDPLLRQIEAANPSAVCGVAAAILAGGFPALDVDARLRWARRFGTRGIERGHIGRWRLILESLVRDGAALDSSLRALYGVILRRLGDWDGAEAVFLDVTAELGRVGQFRDQALVLLEWSLAAKRKGDYRHALNLIEQAGKLRRKEDDLRGRLALLEAHIWVEAGEAERALRLLAGFPEPLSVRLLIVKSEAYLSLGEYAVSRQYAEAALRLIEAGRSDLVTQASLYTTSGRAYEGEGDLAAAESAFSRVVSILEQAEDAYALARAQTNLAALLIKRHGYADARRLLNAAESVQVKLGDQVGLMTTRHNRAILHQAL